uniref:Ubiquitin fusion degradation protein UFD1 N-terminal subdomain 2 domain-containing protein n=2 Tax=Trieres chinensis TaxID=1514140 RepID=A0A7S2EWG4_TRICV
MPARGAEDPGLDKVVGGAIDFRSPSNYVFLPRWMMIALALKPRDVVDVRLVETVPPGSAVKLRPHSSEFVKIGNHQAVLETELKHYSALTKGATIPFDYNNKRYYFDVVDLRSAPRGEKVPMAKVQDCDIAAEFVRAKDQLKPKKDKD